MLLLERIFYKIHLCWIFNVVPLNPLPNQPFINPLTLAASLYLLHLFCCEMPKAC